MFHWRNLGEPTLVEVTRTSTETASTTVREKTKTIELNETIIIRENISEEIVENITTLENVTLNISENITVPVNITQNISINISENITLNITQEINITENITIQLQEKIVYFEDICIETCTLINISKNIILRIEIEDAVLNLTQLKYTFEELNITINETLNITNITFTPIQGTFNQTIWDALSNGTVRITIYANDTVGNVGVSEVLIRKGSTPTDGDVPTSIPFGSFYLVCIVFCIVSLVWIVNKKTK